MNESTPFAPVPILTGEKMPATRKLRPAALGGMTLAMIAFNILGRFMPHNPSKLSTAANLTIFVIFSSLEIWVYVYFWKGRNWARLLTMLGCLIELLGLTVIRKLPVLSQAYEIVHLVFSAALFYWLLQKPVVAFFKAPGTATSKPHEVVADSSVTSSFGL